MRVQGWASVIGDAVELQFVLFLECTEQSGGCSLSCGHCCSQHTVGDRPIDRSASAGSESQCGFPPMCTALRESVSAHSAAQCYTARPAVGMRGYTRQHT